MNGKKDLADDHVGAAPTAQCPFASQSESQDADRRKATHGEWLTGAGVEQVGDTWHVSSLDVARQILRSRHTTQAGFSAEQSGARLPEGRKPVLFVDGAEHKKQRGMIARFFAPTTVSSTYEDLMEQYARETLAELDRNGEFDLGDAALGYSVRVAAHIVGLDASDPIAMGNRLMWLFRQDLTSTVTATTPYQKLAGVVRSTWATLPVVMFTTLDVRPAVRARQKTRRQDVISHLLDQEYSLAEIATECITYAAAGMVTTRQFIAMVAWHLLGDQGLKARYLEGSQEQRYAILHEILRLEPVVGQIFRRATEDIQVEHEGRTHTIAAGELVALSVKDANVEADAYENPRGLCPERETRRGVRPEGMAFGEGIHRCPGNAVAIQETDIFLRHLLSRDVELRSEPSLSQDELIVGYQVEGLRIGLKQPAAQD